MTVTTTPRLGLTRWSAGTDPFTKAQMDASHATLEANVALAGQGPIANRPAPGVRSRFWMTDAGILSYDNGTAWADVRPDLTAYSTTAQTAQLLAQKADAIHTHDASATTSGIFSTARLASGAPGSTTFLRGDQTWAPLPAAALSALNDVTVTSPTTGQALRWNGTKWVNAFLATGDVTGLDSALNNRALVNHVHTKAQITDFAHTHLIADLPVAASGQVSSSLLVRSDDARLADSRTPAGTAAGHLAGSYPNPQVLLIGYADSRNVASVPSDYNGIARWQIKTGAILGLDSMTPPVTVAFVYGFRQSTEGAMQAWEYAHGSTGSVYRRRSSSDTAWGAWQQVEKAGVANVFSDDPRMNDARQPVAHAHDDLYYRETEVDAFRKSDRPIGEVTYYYGTSTGMGPDWLCLNGNQFSAANYPGLYALLGNSTTLPNAVDKIIVGANGNPGVQTSKAVGSTTGSWSKTLTVDQMPSHDHAVYDPGHSHNSGFMPSNITSGSGTSFQRAAPGAQSTGASGTGIGIYPNGGGQPFDITPPVLALWPMIRAR